MYLYHFCMKLFFLWPLKYFLYKAWTKYYENKFSEIRELGMCNKTCDNHNSIDINDFNEKFSKIPTPVIPCNYYKNYTLPVRIRNTFKFFQLLIINHIIKIRSNAMGLDNIHRLFIKLLLPKFCSHIWCIY